MKTRQRFERGPSPRAAARALGLAGALGVAGDLLLREGPLGPGAALWVLLLGVAAWLLQPRRAVLVWSGVAVAAAASTMIRSAEVLQLLLLGVLVLSAAMVTLEIRGRRFGRTRVADHLHSLARVPWLTAAGAAPLLARAELSRPPAERHRAVALGRGLLLAMPPVAVFLALFTAADPVFERALARIGDFGLSELPQHALLAVLFGWIAAGLLRGVLPGPRQNPLTRVRPRIGIEETAMVLGLVTTLFAAFVVLQLGYMFGGRATVEAVTGLTLADYARRGFFEMVAAAVLVLALLLGVGAAAPRGAGRWVFRGLAGALVALVLVVMASASLRLRLYVHEFGLTTDRFLGAAVIGWLTLMLGWYAATVLRGRPRPFASGAVVLSVLTVFTLVAVNPDDQVARVNLSRDDGRAVDGLYLAGISADAVPRLLRQLDRIEADRSRRCALALRLEQRWIERPDESTWRSWNLARARATAAAEAAAPDLRRMRVRNCVPVRSPSGGELYWVPPRVAEPAPAGAPLTRVGSGGAGSKADASAPPLRS